MYLLNNLPVILAVRTGDPASAVTVTNCPSVALSKSVPDTLLPFKDISLLVVPSFSNGLAVLLASSAIIELATKLLLPSVSTCPTSVTSEVTFEVVI